MIKSFLLTAAIFLSIDFIWIFLIAKPLFLKWLEELGRGSATSLGANIPAAIGVYILLVLGLFYFGLNSNPSSLSSSQALFRGALFGLVSYGTYALTAYALIEKWPLGMALGDLIWGAVVCGLTAVIVQWISVTWLT